MVKIINGRILAEKIKDDIVKEIIKLNHGKSELVNKRPNLAIILIGERQDSELYVNLKEQQSKKVGIDTHLYKCPKDISECEIFKMIDCLNKDELIDGILVQLPLPKEFNADTIIKAVDPAKDVDGFHPDNLRSLFSVYSHQRLPLLKLWQTNLMPPVFATVLEMLDSIDCNLRNKRVCIVCNADIFGKNLAKILKYYGPQIKIAYINDNDFKNKTRQADVLITAIGKPEFIKKDMVKKNAVVIDIGITKKDKKVYGDVDFKNVKDKASYISPVPGGVGPMTIAMALKNTLELYKKRR